MRSRLNFSLSTRSRTGGRPTLRSYEMICFYLSGWADLDEVTTHLKKLANSKKTN